MHRFDDHNRPRFYRQEPIIDAGMIADPETIRATCKTWLLASAEEIDSLRNLPLYANQQYFVEEDLMTGDTLVHMRYLIPCITTLKEQQ